MIQEQSCGPTMETEDNQNIQVSLLPNLNLSLHKNTLLRWKNPYDYKKDCFGFQQNSFELETLMIWSPAINHALLQDEDDQNEVLDSQTALQHFVNWILMQYQLKRDTFKSIPERQENRKNCYRTIGQDIVNLSKDQQWKDDLTNLISGFMVQVATRLKKNVNSQLAYSKKDIKSLLPRIAQVFINNPNSAHNFFKTMIDKYDNYVDTEQGVHYAYKLLLLITSEW